MVKSRPAADAALFGILGGLTFAAKMVMASLPNIEPVSLMVMLFAVTLGKKALFPIYIYVLLELALNGFGLWTAAYLYIWLVLAGAAWLLRDMQSPLGWAVLSGTFGLLFGALCAPLCLFTGGPAFALSWWLSGVPFDLLHCGGNFLIALFLFCPLRALMQRLLQKYF
ncbi:MAG: hypothetical protein J6A62_05545 [Oscillospiraceae bacterium]|nr:hypothetical protein [Oscillospiraceae bacterium]